jgi:CubicO group peptidase (beta-lactamase class C family)
MTSGFACDDFVPATDCHFEMYKSSDWLDFVLSQPMNHEPGEHWAYCNDCLELLGAIIARKSGMSIADFAQKCLYDPLGIQARQWETGPNQVTEVCGSHRLRPRDMAKLGYLYFKKGNWNGKQVVSEKWVEESTKPQAITPKDEPRTFDYGYLWWQEQMPFKDQQIQVFNAAGLGNQYIFVVPELNLVCAMTAGNYKNSGVDENPALDFFKVYILGAVK